MITYPFNDNPVLGYSKIGFKLNYNLSLKNMSKNIYTKEYKRLLEKLKQARKDSGLTQLEISQKIDKPQSFISKCELGERRIDPIELSKFAKIYKKDINFFIK